MHSLKFSLDLPSLTSHLTYGHEPVLYLICLFLKTYRFLLSKTIVCVSSANNRQILSFFMLEFVSRVDSHERFDTLRLFEVFNGI